MSEAIKWITAILITLVGALLIIGEIWLLILFMKYPWLIAVALAFVAVVQVVKFAIVDRRLS